MEGPHSARLLWRCCFPDGPLTHQDFLLCNTVSARKPTCFSVTSFRLVSRDDDPVLPRARAPGPRGPAFTSLGCTCIFADSWINTTRRSYNILVFTPTTPHHLNTLISVLLSAAVTCGVRPYTVCSSSLGYYRHIYYYTAPHTYCVHAYHSTYTPPRSTYIAYRNVPHSRGRLSKGRCSPAFAP